MTSGTFDPYAWHVDARTGKQWRVKAGMADMRLALVNQLDVLSRRMEHEESFALVDAWHDTKQAILGCEEVREN